MAERDHVARAGALSLRPSAGRLVRSLTAVLFADRDEEPEDLAEPAFVADELVTRAIIEWRARAIYLPRELLSDPAWGILLELLEAELQGRRASLAALRTASGVAASTADRWVRALERHALVAERTDPLDSEKKIVCLSRKGSSVLRRYFHEVVQRGRG